MFTIYITVLRKQNLIYIKKFYLIILFKAVSNYKTKWIALFYHED